MVKKAIFSTVLVIAIVVLVLLSNNYYNEQKILKDNQKEIVQLLQNNLEQVNPILAEFIDTNYDDVKTVISTKVDSKGTSEIKEISYKKQNALWNLLYKI